MSLPRYSEYKASGVDWLGDVPGHWEVAPLKRSFKIVGGSTPKSDQAAYWDGEFTWVTPSDLSKLSSMNINDSQRKITSEGLASCGTSLVPSGSIVLSTRAPIGSLAIAQTELCTNQGCKSLVPLADTQPQFYGYLLSISTGELNIRGKGTTFLELSGDELGAFKVGVPPSSEQQTIAAFLDLETGKIDALIAEQRRLVELLAEKRQAVISHAVTKGLNPDVPMKNSRVEWLDGRSGFNPTTHDEQPPRRVKTRPTNGVPAHWEVKMLKWFSTLHRGYDLTALEQEDGLYPVITSSGVSGMHSKYMAHGPGVVTGRYGSTGRLFYIEESYWPHNTSLFVSDFHGNTPRFVWYVLQTMDFAAHSVKAAVPGIDRNDLHVIPVVVPPVPEQQTIAAFLDTETAKFDTLTLEANRAIELLQERRSALISAAVTGKIDVRGIQTLPE